MSIFGPNNNIAINIAHLWMHVPLHGYKVCFAKVDVALDKGALPPNKETESLSNLSICKAKARIKQVRYGFSVEGNAEDPQLHLSF